MPAAEPDALHIRFYSRIGVVLCIPAAVVFFVFGTAALDANALNAARPCPLNTQDPSSSCLSLRDGVVTEQTPEYRAPTRLTISVGGTAVRVGWTCLNLGQSACNQTTFPPGTHVITEWWRGSVVRLGISNAQRTVATDANPEYQSATRAPFLLSAVLMLSPLLLAGLLRQAPMSVGKLVQMSLAGWPEGRVPVRRLVIWRVALGGWGWTGIGIWFALYLAYVIFSAASTRYTLSPLLVWLCTGLVGFAASGLIAYVYLSHQVQDSNRERWS